MLSELFNYEYNNIGILYQDTNSKKNKLIVIPLLSIDKIEYNDNMKDYIKYNNIIKLEYKKFNDYNNTGIYDKYFTKIFNDYKSLSTKELILNMIQLKFNIFNIINNFINEYYNIGKNPGNHYYINQCDSFNTIIYNIKNDNVRVDDGMSRFIKIFNKLALLLVLDKEFRGNIISVIYNINKFTFNNNYILTKVVNSINESTCIIEEILDTYNNKRIVVPRFTKSIESYDAGIVELNKLLTVNLDNINSDILYNFGINTKSKEIISVSITNNNNYKNNDKIFNNIKNINDQMNSICSNIDKHEIPIIKLNLLINNINTIISTFDEDYKKVDSVSKYYSCPSILDFDNNDIEISLMLRNDTKIYITLNNCNIENYTKEELEEILIILDIVSDGNSKYDQLRGSISNRLSSFIIKDEK
jgi:hypothetical protein